MNKKTKQILLTIIILFVVVALIGGGLCCYKLYSHLQSQDEQIQELKNEIKVIKTNMDTDEVEWSQDGYNYLAIGNSITLHGYADYWWDDDRGMAASEDEKDYVHLVVSYLETNGKDVVENAVNLSSWESNGNDRAEFIELLDPYLYEGLDLVTIQLGENATNLDTWETDFEELISYVKEECPEAQILVVGDFWSNGDRDKEKENAAEVEGVTYVSLDGIKDNEEYYVGLGATVEGKDGDSHTIEHEGAAKHPGDKGMAAIADRIISEIDLSE